MINNFFKSKNLFSLWFGFNRSHNTKIFYLKLFSENDK